MLPLDTNRPIILIFVMLPLDTDISSKGFFLPPSQDWIPQVAKAVERVIPKPVLISEDDPRGHELREMEKKKMEIDREAEAGVRRELWGGLA